MNIFVDFHHSSLLKSFQLLFEKRLGHNVYRPIGEDWYKEGFWKIYNNPETVAQFLTLSQGRPMSDGTPALNDAYPTNSTKDGLYLCKDSDGEVNKAITLDLFKQMDIDIVIASIPDHIKPFKRLIEQYKPNAKFIFQAGNNFDLSKFSPSEIPNVMASANLSLNNDQINLITYHQEFDIDNIFYKASSTPKKCIYSFVNCFSENRDYRFFIDLEREMPEYEFKSFGGQGRDGFCTGHLELANKMREAKYILHFKPGGDGYGHVLFNAAAIGRPIIIKKDYYKGQLAEKLFVDGVTCITVDGLSVDQMKDKINSISDLQYADMCNNIYKFFKLYVDFDKESKDIAKFLNDLR